MNGITRSVVGAIGGLVATISKVLAIDTVALAEFTRHGDLNQVDDLRITIYITLPALVFLGAVVGWVSNEANRMKLLALGAAAPAIIAPWTTGNTSVAGPPTRASIEFVGSAHADDGSARLAQSSPSRVQGLKTLLGLQAETNYWVIVGSHGTEEDARIQAEAINRQNPDLQAWVGKRQPGNPYFPVIVGGRDGYLPLTEARKLQEAAEKSPFVMSNSYLSDYADR